ncbi:hypothetical protein V6N11_006663 [Hibiscus sabdariffa]|uniref:Uncharacterized protein n=1 Tax=Hibiscus sabdariffa TaxID=183260 RepID=A0ABR2RRW5_9ROSI
MVNANSSGNQSLELQGIASGRPPEGVPELGVLPILERPASPLASEEQQLAKKSRGFDSTVDLGGDPNAVINMDTDSIHSAGLGEFQNEKSNLHGKETYAAMAAKGRSGNGVPAIVNDADPDEVFVLDEDCTVDDSGKYPTIRFSDRVHDRVDWSMRHTIIVRLMGRAIGYKVLLDRIYGLWHPRAESCGKSSPPKEDPRPAMPGQDLNHSIEGSNTSIYGPWMIASTRRRGAVKVANSVNPSVSNHTHNRGSRFTALNVDEAADVAGGVADIVAGAVVTASEVTVQEQTNRGAPVAAAVQRHELMKNAAYLASNPTRKSKKGAASKDIIGELNVVPVSSEHAASVVPHNVQRGSSSHNAILIVEPGYEANTGSPSRTGKGRGKGLKGPGEIQRKGFKIHRQNEAKTMGNRVPTLWAKEFAEQIDVLTANEQDPPDISVNRERLETDMDYSSGDGDDLVDSSFEKAKDGTVVPPQGC